MRAARPKGRQRGTSQISLLEIEIKFIKREQQKQGKNVSNILNFSQLWSISDSPGATNTRLQPAMSARCADKTTDPAGNAGLLWMCKVR